MLGKEQQKQSRKPCSRLLASVPWPCRYTLTCLYNHTLSQLRNGRGKYLGPLIGFKDVVVRIHLDDNDR